MSAELSEFGCRRVGRTLRVRHRRGQERNSGTNTQYLDQNLGGPTSESSVDTISRIEPWRVWPTISRGPTSESSGDTISESLAGSIALQVLTRRQCGLEAPGCVYNRHNPYNRRVSLRFWGRVTLHFRLGV